MGSLDLFHSMDKFWIQTEQNIMETSSTLNLKNRYGEAYLPMKENGEELVYATVIEKDIELHQWKS